jgi:hypothetical protein
MDIPGRRSAIPSTLPPNGPTPANSFLRSRHGSVNAVTADGIPTKALRAAKAAIEIMKVRMVSPLG